MKILMYCFILFSFLAGACAPFPGQDMGVALAMSDVEHEQNPQVELADLQALVSGNNEFSFRFYHAIDAQEGNLVFSPLSLSLALGMAAAGAQGTTRTEMLEALNLQVLGDDFHPAFNALLDTLEDSQSELGDELRGDKFTLNIANSSWGQAGFAIEADYLDTLARHYGAGMYSVDFVQNPEGSRKAINDWVKTETTGKIPELIPSGAIDPMTRLVLANAIYFKGSWLHEFDPNSTSDRPFYKLDGSEKSVKMMSLGSEHLSFLRGADFQIVALPYLSSDFSMLVLVPDSGTFLDVEERLSAQSFADMLGEMNFAQVSVWIPKFDFETATSAPQALKELGMPSAFDPALADFSGISLEDDLYITNVLHKATITVDEQGTEASAATAVIMGVTSMPVDEPIQLLIDRPFIFAILHQPSGEILFLGRVLEP